MTFYYFSGFLGEVYIDVNGLKKPNQYGKDLFVFLVSSNGSLIPVGGRDASLLSTGNVNRVWNGTSVIYRCTTDRASNGLGCAARIIEEGWEIKY